MSKRLKRAVVVFIVLFAVAQLVRPGRANPPTDANRTMQAHLDPTSALAGIIDRACSDCHSNATGWPWYTNIAPVSWLWAYSVKQGRNAANFSEWAAYSPERQRTLLLASCQAVSQGKMPGSPRTLLHPEARLSAQDVETICAAARQMQTEASK